MKHLFSVLLALSVMLQSCSDKYSISGTSSQNMLDGKVAYIKQMGDSCFVAIDSCKVVHGQFRMSGILDSIMCVSLFMGNDHCIPIVLEHGDISIRFVNSSITIGGTPLNNALYSFLTTRDSLFLQLAELPERESSMILEGYDIDYIEQTMIRKTQEFHRAIDRLETKFITNNFNNVLGVTWFMHLCNDAHRQYGYPTTTPQIDEIYGLAPEHFRCDPQIDSYMQRVNSTVFIDE